MCILYRYRFARSSASAPLPPHSSALSPRASRPPAPIDSRDARDGVRDARARPRRRPRFARRASSSSSSNRRVAFAPRSGRAALLARTLASSAAPRVRPRRTRPRRETPRSSGQVHRGPEGDGDDDAHHPAQRRGAEERSQGAGGVPGRARGHDPRGRGRARPPGEGTDELNALRLDKPRRSFPGRSARGRSSPLSSTTRRD